MATKNADGTVTLRTQGSLAYTPSITPTTSLSRPATAKSIGGGGFESSGRLAKQKGRSIASKSAR
jgi:hypothetical protein